jgi:hypothetical protein
LAEGFVEEGGAGDGGVEGFYGAGDADAVVSQGEGLGGEAGAFVADEDGGVGGEGGGQEGDRVIGVGVGGVEDSSLLLELGSDLGEGCSGDGEAEDGAGGGANDFGVPGVDGVGGEEELVSTEGFGGADEGAEVAGVLEAFEDEGDGVGLGGGWREGWNEESCGDALGAGGFYGAREDVAAEDEGVVEVKGGLAAFAEEEGLEGEARAEGFGDEVFAFEAEEVAGLRGFAAEGGAEGFDAGVGLARDGRGGRHSIS